MEKDKATHGIVREVTTGQSVGNCSNGAPQPQASQVVDMPDCRKGGKPLTPIP